MDSGNFTGNPDAEGEAKTRALLEGMGNLGYAAVNVGTRDLSLGYDAFLENTKGARFPFVSSNIVRQDNGEPVFDPYVIVEATAPKGGKKLKVGVIGAARYNPLFSKAGPDGTNLVIKKPDDVVKPYVDELRGKVDVVLLLAALHKEEAKRIVRTIGGIDVVVGSYGGLYTTREDRHGDSWLLYSGNQGKRTGESRIYFDPRGKKIASVETHIHLLGAIYPSQQAMLDWVNGVVAKLPKKTVAGAAASAGGH